MAREGRGFGDWRHRDPDADNTGPLDVAAINRDDMLLDAIASDGTVSTNSDEEYQLAALMATWRSDLLAEPIPAGPDLDAVFAAVNQEIGARQAQQAAGAHSGRDRLRLVRPLAGAAAAIALICGGLTAFSYGAEPSDPLWRVKQVVFSEQANSTVAQMDAVADMQEAQRLLTQGNPEEAKASLQRAQQRASGVSNVNSRDQLMADLSRLLTAAQQAVPSTTPSLPASPSMTGTTPPSSTSGAPQSSTTTTPPTTTSIPKPPTTTTRPTTTTNGPASSPATHTNMFGVPDLRGTSGASSPGQTSARQTTGFTKPPMIPTKLDIPSIQLPSGIPGLPGR